MSQNILVLHGPNLNLLGERPGEEKGRSLETVNGLIRSRASELGLAVKILQSNHEGALVDALHAERRWAQGVVINPGALAHYSYVLREALVAAGRPAIEVHLTDIRRRESWRRKSVLKEVCESQVLGKGVDSYLIALERFASGDLKGKRRGRPLRAPKKEEKTLGKKVKAPEVRLGSNGSHAALPDLPKSLTPMAPVKTLGRQAPSSRKVLGDVVTRALVRQKIADRLNGRLTPAGLATWARAKWLEVQRGAPAESGQREVLEDSLQSLALSTIPASRMSDDQLVELMTELE